MTKATLESRSYPPLKEYSKKVDAEGIEESDDDHGQHVLLKIEW